ncbi:MAG: EAL domain-containing protein [Pseudomonadota bacterium]
MIIVKSLGEEGCRRCVDSPPLDFELSMAFQPIVDAYTGKTFAHEALVRGVNGESAASIFEKVHDGNRYRFDQACRVKAVELASRLGLEGFLSINFLPNAVYKPELCIRTTLLAAERFEFAPERLIFEVTESERIKDVAHLQGIIQHYQKRGFMTAIDDFGAGYAGLNLLAELNTDLVKIDMALVRNVHETRTKSSIIRGIIQVCRDLDIRIIAEGVETREEFIFLEGMGIQLFQGFYFSKPSFESIEPVDPSIFRKA